MKNRTMKNILAISIVVNIAMISLFAVAGSKSEDEALYLSHAIKDQITTQKLDFTQKSEYLTNLELFHKDYDGNGSKYYWFTLPKTEILAMGKSTVSGSGNKHLPGYYVLTDKDNRIADFGWHKP